MPLIGHQNLMRSMNHLRFLFGYFSQDFRHISHSLILKSMTALIGKYIHRDNSTACATWTDGARVCLQVDAAKDLLPYLWIDVPGMHGSRKQEVVFETLPTYYSSYKCQGHNVKTCRNGGEHKKKVKGGQVWVNKGVKVRVKDDGNQNKSETPTGVSKSMDLDTNKGGDMGEVLVTQEGNQILPLDGAHHEFEK